GGSMGLRAASPCRRGGGSSAASCGASRRVSSRPRRRSSCWASPGLTERLVLDVERRTFGLDALAHHDGEVVFLPYAAPGDRVTASVIARHRGYLQAEVDAVERPGPGRVLPGCAFFPRCGGCQWQHVAPPGQREAKAAGVARAPPRGGRRPRRRGAPALPPPPRLGGPRRGAARWRGRPAGPP